MKLTASQKFTSRIRTNSFAIVIPHEEVERLVSRFGARVRSGGKWDHATDGSLEVPIANLVEAAKRLGGATLSAAIRQLQTPRQPDDSSSAAVQFSEVLLKLYLDEFEEKCRRYQEASDPAEVRRLRDEISRELFGA